MDNTVSVFWTIRYLWLAESGQQLVKCWISLSQPNGNSCQIPKIRTTILELSCWRTKYMLLVDILPQWWRCMILKKVEFHFPICQRGLQVNKERWNRRYLDASAPASQLSSVPPQQNRSSDSNQYSFYIMGLSRKPNLFTTTNKWGSYKAFVTLTDAMGLRREVTTAIILNAKQFKN